MNQFGNLRTRLEKLKKTTENVDLVGEAVNLLKERRQLHAFIVNAFRQRFETLETIVSDFETFARVGLWLATHAKLSPDIESLLNSRQKIAVNIGLIELGPEIHEQEFFDVCELAIDASQVTKNLTDRASKAALGFAPNLCELVGAEIAAMLVSFAGGLQQLSATPASTIKGLGAHRVELLGYSSHESDNFHGIVYNAEVVLSAPVEVREFVFRDIANKVALVSRVDASGTVPDGSFGRTTRENAAAKLDKRLHNTAIKIVRPLPVPGLEKKPSRGGRQKRAMKKKFGMGEELTARSKVLFGIGGQFDETGQQFGSTVFKKGRHVVA